jgi:hypothetical protein
MALNPITDTEPSVQLPVMGRIPKGIRGRKALLAGGFVRLSLIAIAIGMYTFEARLPGARSYSAGYL